MFHTFLTSWQSWLRTTATNLGQIVIVIVGVNKIATKINIKLATTKKLLFSWHLIFDPYFVTFRKKIIDSQSELGWDFKYEIDMLWCEEEISKLWP